MPDADVGRPRGPALLTGALIAVVALLLGYLVLYVLEWLIGMLWDDLASDLTGVALWALAIGVPTVAGVLVALLRRREDDHNPLGGIAMAPLTARQYPWVIAAIAATLVGGLVLGPEVALVSTGSFVGTWFAQRRGGLTVARGTMVGVIAAVLALFIGPLVGGTFAVSSGYTFRPADVVGAIGTAVVTALLLAIGRFAALGLVRVRGGDHPQIVVIPAIGALVGGLALAYTLITGNPIALVLTSGEGYVREALALGTTGAIVVVTLVKLLAYTLSMGGGFRGGPYFPAIFVGGGVGGVATLVLPNYAQSGAAAGIAAAVAYLAHAKWGATAVIGLVLAAFTGSWQVAPITLLAALVGRAIPKVELAAPKPEDAPASTSPSSG